MAVVEEKSYARREWELLNEELKRRAEPLYEIKQANELMGNGVFAKVLIKAGTPLHLEVHPDRLKTRCNDLNMDGGALFSSDLHRMTEALAAYARRAQPSAAFPLLSDFTQLLTPDLDMEAEFKKNPGFRPDRQPHLLLASRDIQPGEQLCTPYGLPYWTEEVMRWWLKAPPPSLPTYEARFVALLPFIDQVVQQLGLDCQARLLFSKMVNDHNPYPDRSTQKRALQNLVATATCTSPSSSLSIK